MSVQQAAGRLEVSEIQVRRLIAAGELDADRFGRSWQIDLGSLQRYVDLRPAVGRPLGADRAWGELLSANPSSLDDARRLANRVRRRAVRRLARAAPGEVAHLIDDARIRVSGASAAASLGAPVQDRPPFAIYVDAKNFDRVVADHVLLLDPDEHNLVIRIADHLDDRLPDHVAPAVVALIDLVDDRDDRSAREVLPLVPGSVRR